MVSTKLEELTELRAPIDRLIVKEIEVENKTLGGIIITEKSGDPDNKARLGVVISSGEDSETKQELLSIDSKIYFSKFCGVNIQIDDQKYISIHKSDIVAVLV